MASGSIVVDPFLVTGAGYKTVITSNSGWGTGLNTTYTIPEDGTYMICYSKHTSDAGGNFYFQGVQDDTINLKSGEGMKWIVPFKKGAVVRIWGWSMITYVRRML